MRRRLPPLKQLVAFEAVARHRSFSLAADNLCLTSGAISRQVKTLEEHFGEPLFHRLTNRIKLTPAGRRLLLAVNAALDGLESTAGDILAEKQQGTLVVSCLPTFAMYWLVRRLGWFSAVHPDIEVHVTLETNPKIFCREEVDIAIGLAPMAENEGFVCHEILSELHGPVCSPLLAAHDRSLDVESLTRLTLLHTAPRLDAWKCWCESFGFSRIDESSGPHFAHAFLMLQAAVTGQGVGIGTYPVVAEDIENGRLIAPFGFVPSGKEYSLVYPRERENFPKIKAFRDWLELSACKDTHMFSPEERLFG